jgi:hypothetical protein
MKRSHVLVLLGVLSCAALAYAQPKPKAQPKPTVTQPKPKPSAKVSTKDAGPETHDTNPTAAAADAGPATARVEKTLDGGVKVFRFGELEVEGRLRSPQLVYFLRRVRAEFAAGDLGHRSFMLELSQTKQSDNF